MLIIKTHRISFCLLSIVFTLISSTVSADTMIQRQGYSFFGAGFDLLDYEENTTREIGGQVIDVETPSATNFTQQSGAYVAIDADWGFYLTTASTLGESSTDEEWVIGSTLVRTNRVAFERQRLAGIATLRMQNSRYLLFGAQYSKSEFKRFAASLTADAASFGLTDTTFTSGTISENVWDMTLVAGYEWNTLFKNKMSGWKYQLQLMAGLPVYSSVTNTDIDNGASFSDSFDGFHLQANFIYGYQFSENAVAGFSLESAYSQRNEIDTQLTDAAGTIKLPESNLFYFYPGFTMYWSF